MATKTEKTAATDEPQHATKDDPLARKVDTLTIEENKPLSEAIEADQALADKPHAGPPPPIFVHKLGKHPETRREQALRQSGDGTLDVWPPQPIPDNPNRKAVVGKPE